MRFVLYEGAKRKKKIIIKFMQLFGVPKSLFNSLLKSPFSLYTFGVSSFFFIHRYVCRHSVYLSDLFML